MADPLQKNIQIKDVEGNLLFPKTKAAVVFNNNNENLGGVEAGAQVNKIEEVQVNGTALAITDKKVNVVIPAAAEYTIAKAATATEGYLATYNLTKDGVITGASIDIPKDFLVKSGSVKTCTVKDQPISGLEVGDPYIDFVINTKDGSGTDEHMYINVKNLVEFPTVEDTDSVDLTMSADHKISADVKLSTVENNALVVKTDEGKEGLFVDISNKADKATTLAGYGIGDAYTKEEVNTELGKKQNNLSEAQLAAASSGITAEKLATIEAMETGKVDANAAITAGTKCKITYDAKGLVTAGADLAASDIPSLELSKILDVTATAAELNVLDGIEASTTELNYVKGVTSAIQTQLDGKAAKATTLSGYGITDGLTYEVLA